MSTFTRLWLFAGLNFAWKRRIGERDGEVARALADQNLKNGVERVARNRKIVEMGLVQVAKAIAEGKVKPTISDLDRLVRLEEFLRRGATAREGEGSLLDEIKRRYAARHKDKGYT